MRFATLAVHAGEREPAADFTPVSTPIYSSATFLYSRLERIDQIAAGAEPGYMYGRYANPTCVALEKAVLALESAGGAVGEGGAAAFSFGSGMAALHAAILASGVQAGDAVVCSQEVYGATIGLLMNVLAPLGVEVTLVDATQASALEQALARRPRLVIVEAISNPLVRVIDLAVVAAAAHAAGAKLLVDATFATPLLCRPLALGADYVMHSATKYLAGHGDVVGGIVVARAEEGPALFATRKLVGGILGPFEAWLTLRGLKTLPLRMERQCRSALRIAEALAAQPAVARVHYPGLARHPDHALAARQFGGLFGAIVSFELRGAGRAEVFAWFERLRLCLAATSLGDVQTLVLYPAISSHRDLSPKQRERIGIGENLIRLSAGIEDPADIIADLEQAMA